MICILILINEINQRRGWIIIFYEKEMVTRILLCYLLYQVILQYNSQNEINGKVKLVVKNGAEAVPPGLRDEIDEAILKFMTDDPDIDYHA